MQSILKIEYDLSFDLKNIANKDNQYTIPIFIPHLGCKNECVFCNQKKISGTQKIDELLELEKNIDDCLRRIDNGKDIQIAFFGGSFTGIDIEKQIEYLKLANKYISNGLVSSIRISTRPDYIDTKILEILKNFNVQIIELGVQSTDNNVLKICKRGHIYSDVIKASNLIKSFGIDIGFQIMIGLPGSNSDIELKGIKKLIEIGPKQLRIYPVYVLQDSELYNMYKNNEYIPLTLEEAIERTAIVVKECNKTNIQIIRIGLQSTSEITSKNDKIIGPICDNFAEYVLSRIVLQNIEIKLDKLLVEDVENVTNEIQIVVDKKYISIAVGPKKRNKIHLENKYGMKINFKGE